MDDTWRPGWPFYVSNEGLVDLRSRGVEVMLLNGIYQGQGPAQCQNHFGRVHFDCVMGDVRNLRDKLARADSFGFKVYADPKTFDDPLHYWGHSPSTNPDYPYFRYNGDSINYRYTAAEFDSMLDEWVS